MKLTRKYRKQIADMAMLLREYQMEYLGTDGEEMKAVAERVMELDIDEAPLTFEYVRRELTGTCWRMHFVESLNDESVQVYDFVKHDKRIQILFADGVVHSTLFCDDELMGGRLKEFNARAVME